MSWYHASARRTVLDAVNARRLHLSVLLCVHVKETAHRIDVDNNNNIIQLTIKLQNFIKNHN